MNKQHLLKYIEIELYSSLTSQLAKIEGQSIALNDGVGFTYRIFSNGSLAPRKLAVYDFVDEQLEPLKDELDHKVKVMGFLLKFLNYTPHPVHIFHLLPSSIGKKASYEMPPDYTNDLLEEFRCKPEYQMLMAQYTLNKMGV